MKIMVCYDKTDAARNALKLAQKHAKVFGAQVHILTSLAQSSTLKLEDIQKVEFELENLKLPFKEDGIECETHASISFFSPGEDMVQFAKENKIDEIFIGIKKKSKTGKLLFGSNAQYIILHAQCPVVTVK